MHLIAGALLVVSTTAAFLSGGPGLSRRRPRLRALLEDQASIAQGNYGEVVRGVLDGRRLVAKRAGGLLGEAELARQYLDVEAAATEAVRGLPGFAPYAGERTCPDGERWLTWEDCGAVPLRESAAVPAAEAARGLTAAVVALHAAGWVHRDIKPDNVLVDPSREDVLLVDLGSAARLGKGLAGALAAARGNGEGYDATRSPCSPVYAAPEKYVDPSHPRAFDVYSLGLTLASLAWRPLATDDGVAKFRAELDAAGGDLDAWLRAKAASTVIEPGLADSLEAWPGAAGGGWAALRAMLHSDPKRRPAAADLPWVGGAAFASAAPSEALATFLDTACALPAAATQVEVEVSVAPLSVRVRLEKPLGLVLEEADGGGLRIAADGIAPGGAAAACGLLADGDKLVSVDDSKNVRRASFEAVMGLLARPTKARTTVLLFERDCGQSPDGCAIPVAVAAGDSSGRPAVGVVDAGASVVLGGRATQEDAHVLTELLVEGGDRFTLAAVFDGHRGPAASEHAAEVFGPALQAALAGGAADPLETAWDEVVASYLATGAEDGATATAALIGGGAVSVLNVGDSRTLLAASVGAATPVVELATRDHSAADAAEQVRVEAGGGTVECVAGGQYRVAVPGKDGTWRLEVARALGGREWVAGGIVADPDTFKVGLAPRHDAIICASDGVWATVPSEEAVWMCDRYRRKGVGAGEAAQGLVDAALEAGSKDNVSAVVIYLG